MRKPYTIGITGPTASGKSYIVKKLWEEFKNDIVFIPQDNYYKDSEKADLEEWFRANLDTPAAFENEELAADLKKLLSGSSITMPQYDFSIRKRLKRQIKLNPKSVIILEGILIFNIKEIRDLLDFKVFLDASSDIRLARRLLRDIQEKRLDIKHLKKSINWYLKTVKPMQDKYILPMKKYADLILNTDEGAKKAAEILKEHIKGILKNMGA